MAGVVGEQEPAIRGFPRRMRYLTPNSLLSTTIFSTRQEGHGVELPPELALGVTRG